MSKLLMISGDRSLAEGKRGAFYNTLEEFHKYWDRIDIICPKIRNPKSEILNKSEIQNSKPIICFDNVFIHPSTWPLILQPFWILKKGREIYREQNFDLMTVHEYPPFYNGIGAKFLHRKTKVPYVLEIMHVPGYPKAANAKEEIYKTFLRFFIKSDASKAKAIRVINKNQTPDFLIKAGVAKGKLIYIPAFYIDLDIFRPQAVEKEYDLIFVGRLAENKGLKLFVDAVKSTSLKGVVVGSGELEGWLRKNKPSNLELFGWVKGSQEVAELINKSKLLIMASSNEGGPRVILEAIACGVPVLATPVGIVPDIIKDGGSGRIIDWNIIDIASKADELLSNPKLYEICRKNGLEIAKKFEKKQAIRNYAEELKKVIQS